MNMNSISIESLSAEYQRLIVIAVLCTGFVILNAGCGRQISHEKQVEVDGTEVTTHEKTVTEKTDGTIKVTEKKTTEDPSDGTKDSETETKTYNK